MQDLSAQLARVAREIATVLGRAGHRAWIVGGAPRDLSLGREPSEIDMSSDARPEEVEALFLRTIPVGRAFGTVVIHLDGLDVQHTTFRSEGTYYDMRRPDAVSFGTSVDEDSRRRDFTCNALYLDPSTDELVDPQRGLDDLAARRLACVGDPRKRFEEDGLRLLRMARFAAVLELEPGPGVLAAAGAARATLRGVSPERILAELGAILEQPRALRALDLLEQCGLLEIAMPGVWGSGSGAAGAESAWRRARELFSALPEPPGLVLGLAALLDARRARASSNDEASDEEALEIVRALRASRSVQELLRDTWRLVRAMEESRDRGIPPPRSERVRWMRSDAFAGALALAVARASIEKRPIDRFREIERERERMSAEEMHPPALVGARELEAARIPRGPAWGELLREIETMQLDGRLATREDALAWIASRETRDHEGGKTPRKR